MHKVAVPPLHHLWQEGLERDGRPHRTGFPFCSAASAPSRASDPHLRHEINRSKVRLKPRTHSRRWSHKHSGGGAPAALRPHGSCVQCPAQRWARSPLMTLSGLIVSWACTQRKANEQGSSGETMCSAPAQKIQTARWAWPHPYLTGAHRGSAPPAFHTRSESLPCAEHGFLQNLSASFDLRAAQRGVSPPGREAASGRAPAQEEGRGEGEGEGGGEGGGGRKKQQQLAFVALAPASAPSHTRAD